MPPRPHILIVNDRLVRQPVFVIGAPHSGAELLARALKRSQGFHVTIGQEVVQDVVHAFARSPSIQRGRSDAAATVLRDAFAQAWQVTAHGCLTCSQLCREAGQVSSPSRCVAERDILRYGDATPDLMYCADELVEAFPDARLVQIVRDGRDVVAAMLSDAQTPGWFKRSGPGMEPEFPNPFLGIETAEDLALWPDLGVAGKCAMRWRGSVRAMARLRSAMSAEQLTTLRYEDLVRDPVGAAALISDFIGATAGRIQVRSGRDDSPASAAALAIAEPGAWRRQLTVTELSEIESVAGPELRRIGYRD
jgi:hypothetical protein